MHSFTLPKFSTLSQHFFAAISTHNHLHMSCQFHNLNKAEIVYFVCLESSHSLNESMVCIDVNLTGEIAIILSSNLHPNVILENFLVRIFWVHCQLIPRRNKTLQQKYNVLEEATDFMMIFIQMTKTFNLICHFQSYWYTNGPIELLFSMLILSVNETFSGRMLHKFNYGQWINWHRQQKSEHCMCLASTNGCVRFGTEYACSLSLQTLTMWRSKIQPAIVVFKMCVLMLKLGNNFFQGKKTVFTKSTKI